MKQVVIFAWLLLAANAARPDDVFGVSPELWDRPRSGRAVMNQPGVRQAMDRYLTRPAARLVIHHGYGQESLLQAEELRMWLMSLAVDGTRVSLTNDTKTQDPLKIEVK